MSQKKLPESYKTDDPNWVKPINENILKQEPTLLVETARSRNELPTYATPGSAGMDLRADGDWSLDPGEVRLIPTGLAIAIPEGHEGQVRPRSGLAARHGVTVLNSPGTIDSDYRGEVKVLLINHGKECFRICHGDRIAQLVIAPFSRCQVREVENLDETSRGSGGFGSTGKR